MNKFFLAKFIIFSFFIVGMGVFMTQLAVAYTCGNGVKETGEVCDWGTNNSDVAPNACRTDCRMAYCGDSVMDNGEQCDDGQQSYSTSGTIQPLSCRNGCQLPRCGDGVVDNGTRNNTPRNTYNEQCDDGNSSNEDGCLNSCKSCVVLGAVGNIEITDDTNICSGEVTLDDYGDYGTIIIKRSDVTLNCNHAVIKGEGRGVGIKIFRSHNVTIKNCEVYGYEVGIQAEDSNNITLSGNRLCGNSIADIEYDEGTTQMTGRNNACGKPGNWNDTGKTGCSQNIPVCNPPSVPAGAMVAQRLGVNAKAALQSMPQVSAQTNKTPVAPLAEKMKVQQLKPVKALPKKKAVVPLPSSRRTVTPVK